MLVALTVALAVGLGSTSASAKPPPMPKDKKARKHFDTAIELYGTKEYEASIAEAKAGLELEEHESLLFILAQAERQSGNCVDAVETFTRFIEVTESDDMRQNALTAKALCAEELAELAKQAEIAAQEAAALEAEVEPEPEPPPPPPPPKPFYLDPLGDALVGAGAVAVISGTAVMLAGALGPKLAPDYGVFVERTQRQPTFYLAGGITLGAGVLLAAGGAVRWVLLAKANKAQTESAPATARVGRVGHVGVAPWIDPRRAGVVLRARF